MVPPRMARVFTKHHQVIISSLCPTGMGLEGVDVKLVTIGEALRCWWLPQIAPFFLIAHAQRAAGRQYRCSQCGVGLCAVPCNERYRILKNYRLSPRYLIGQMFWNYLPWSYFFPSQKPGILTGVSRLFISTVNYMNINICKYIQLQEDQYSSRCMNKDKWQIGMKILYKSVYTIILRALNITLK